MNGKTTAITGGKLIIPSQVFERGCVLVRGGKIVAAGAEDSIALPEGCQVIDASGKIVVPGFVEVHIHGYGGVMMGDPEVSPVSPTKTVAGDILHVARTLPSTGITGFLPTFLAVASFERLLEVLVEAQETIRRDEEGAQVLGFHLEGPYFNTAPRGPYDRYPPGGAIPPELSRAPNLKELERLLAASGDQLRMMSISPELPGAVDAIRQLASCGIVPSGAHSFASYAQVLEAVEAGMSTVTHMYNGMRHQAHRDPGIIEAALVCDRITIQIIADGVHVHSPALEIAYRCKGAERIAITTDNTAWAGLPDGEYRDHFGRKLIKKPESIEVAGGPLYGSVMAMNEQLRNLFRNLGLPLEQVIAMATIIPARLIGVDVQKGSLEAGKDADLVILDENLQVLATFRNGQRVFPF